MTNERFGKTVFLMVFFLLFLGCGHEGDLVPAEGVVRLDGKPLGNAGIYFVPQGGTGMNAYAESDSDGSFRAATSGRSGASPGNYKIVVVPAPTNNSNTMSEAEWKSQQNAQKSSASEIPKIYGNSATTPLNCTLPADDGLVLDLTSSSS